MRAMLSDKLSGYLGFASRARKLQTGYNTVLGLIEKRKARLVIVAEDASERSKKAYTDMCTFYETKLCVYGTKETLGHILGKEIRTALAVTDEALAETIEQKMNSTEA